MGAFCYSVDVAWFAGTCGGLAVKLRGHDYSPGGLTEAGRVVAQPASGAVL